MLPVDEPLNRGAGADSRAGSRPCRLAASNDRPRRARGPRPRAAPAGGGHQGLRAGRGPRRARGRAHRFGENRVQEAEPKVEAVPDAEWHMIGRLQSNKARRAVGAVHGDPLGRFARAAGSAIDAHRRDDDGRGRACCSRSTSAAARRRRPGSSARVAAASRPARRRAGDRRIAGLMTIAPMGASVEDAARRHFAALRELRDELRAAAGPSPARAVDGHDRRCRGGGGRGGDAGPDRDRPLRPAAAR